MSGKQVNISPELHERLVVAANERSIGIGFLAERAIADYLDRLIPVDELRLTRDAPPPAPPKPRPNKGVSS